jgi:hypothetical protein
MLRAVAVESGNTDTIDIEQADTLAETGLSGIPSALETPPRRQLRDEEEVALDIEDCGLRRPFKASNKDPDKDEGTSFKDLFLAVRWLLWRTFGQNCRIILFCTGV